MQIFHGLQGLKVLGVNKGEVDRDFLLPVGEAEEVGVRALTQVDRMNF